MLLNFDFHGGLPLSMHAGPRLLIRLRPGARNAKKEKERIARQKLDESHQQKNPNVNR